MTQGEHGEPGRPIRRGASAGMPDAASKQVRGDGRSAVDLSVCFSGKTVVVTGGASGIGAATASLLSAWGATVLRADRDWAARASASGGQPGRSLHVVADVGTGAGRAAIAARADEAGNVIGLVNCAGLFVESADWHTADRWREVMEVNLLGPVELCRLLAPALRQSSGAVVNVGSISGSIAQNGLGAYAASKAGLAAATRSMAISLGKLGVRINTVSPGWIWTRPNQLKTGNDRPKWDAQVSQWTCLGRGGDSGEVATVIAFLLSPLASYIHGANIVVDGGYLCLGPEGNSS